MQLATRAVGSRVLSPLRHRPFALLWLGRTVSMLGDRVYATALPFVVLGLGGTAAQLSLTFVYFMAPQLVFLLLGGVVVDRFSRRTTMLLADFVRAAIVALLTGLLLTGSLRIGHVYAVSASFGFFSAFFTPAVTSLVPELVPAERLVAANALNSLATELTGIIGPALGGLLVASGVTALALGFDAFSFVVSGLCLLGIGATYGRVRARVEPPAGGLARYWRDLAGGFGVVASSQWLWVTIVLFSVGNIFMFGGLTVALPVLVSQELGGARSYGLILSAMATGSMLAALLLGHIERPPRRGVLAYGGIAVGGVSMVGISIAQNTLQAGLIAAVLGASIIQFELIWQATLQELVPREALGRVVSIDMLGSFALLPIGVLVVGALVEESGPRTALVIGGAAGLALALVGLSLRSIRDLR